MSIATVRDSIDFSIPLSGRVAIAKLVKESVLHLAWGAFPSGQTSWSSEIPSPEVTDTKLMNEVGRRLVVIKKYVTPATNGEITTSTGSWSESTNPTRHVYLKVDHDLTDASDSTVVQIGLFTGTVVKPTSTNKTWLLPSELTSIGTLLACANIQPIVRNSATKESRQFVLTF